MAKVKKKRNVKVDPEGVVHIQATFNNIIISICNKAGQVISWASAGKACLLYTSPSPRDLSTSRMPSSA